MCLLAFYNKKSRAQAGSSHDFRKNGGNRDWTTILLPESVAIWVLAEVFAAALARCRKSAANKLGMLKSNVVRGCARMRAACMAYILSHI